MKDNLYKYINKSDWKSIAFCKNKAYVCCRLSKLIYSYKPTKLNDRTKIYGINDIDFSEDLGIKEFRILISNLDFRLIFIIQNKDFIIIGLSIHRAIFVVSRGTSYWKDWVNNLKLFRTRICYMKNLKFHTGFNNIAIKTIDGIYKEISNETAPIYFTGHSLGGALSGIFYYYFTSSCNCIRNVMLKNEISAYTFGMPRFSNKTLKQTDSLFNLYNPLDIVPKTPPKIFGYTDQKCEYKLSESGLEISKEYEHIGLLKAIKVVIKGNVAKEHSIEKYLSFLHLFVNK